jgi:hypothetical protein
LGVLPQYYIKQGVRRCVAAREEGLIDITAIVVEEGKPDILTRLQLNQLHSPKHEVLRDYRYIRNTEYPTRVLRTEPLPIIVEPLRLPRRGSSIPISRVALQ